MAQTRPPAMVRLSGKRLSDALRGKARPLIEAPGNKVLDPTPWMAVENRPQSSGDVVERVRIAHLAGGDE